STTVGASSSASIARVPMERFESSLTRSCSAKGDRPYFKETIKLAENEIYVSPIDLNQENGAVEIPDVPTLRVATPIFAPHRSACSRCCSPQLWRCSSRRPINHSRAGSRCSRAKSTSTR
ncbi:MAG: hypothetical protein WA813_07605, partial [Beijerinckiaceae bacterium]